MDEYGDSSRRKECLTDTAEFKIPRTTLSFFTARDYYILGRQVFLPPLTDIDGVLALYKSHGLSIQTVTLSHPWHVFFSPSLFVLTPPEFSRQLSIPLSSIHAPSILFPLVPGNRQAFWLVFSLGPWTSVPLRNFLPVVSPIPRRYLGMSHPGSREWISITTLPSLPSEKADWFLGLYE